MMIKINLIKKLILHSAFSGKLVYNKQFTKTGSQYLIEKNIRGLENIDFPYVVPKKWTFAYLGDLVKIYTGKKDANFADLNGNFPFFTCANKPTTCNSYSYDGEYLLMPGNGASIGLVFYYHGKFEAYQRTYLLENIKDINLKYLKYHIEYNWLEFNHNKMHGAATPFIKIANLLYFPIGLPSLEEQEAIVSKLDEIFAELDKIDEKQTRLATIQEKMETKILKLAIQGKLVEQRPEEGTGEELFKLIQQEKQELIKQGKIKKEKPLPVIEEDEIPFEIPSTWKWVRLSQITYNHGQKTPNNRFSYIDIGSIDNINHCLNRNENIIEQGNAPSRARKIVCEGDIVYSTVRPYLHNIAIIDKKFSEEPIASTGFAILSCTSGVVNKYVFWCLLSSYFDCYANMDGNAKGVMYPAISDDKLSKGLIPLPPLEEQNRIVAKIEELLPLCRRN